MQKIESLLKADPLTPEDIERVFQALPTSEKVAIDLLAERLEKEVKRRYGEQHPDGKLMFGRRYALEILAKTGIWLIRAQPAMVS